MGRRKFEDEIALIKDDIITEIYNRLMPDLKSLINELSTKMEEELKSTFSVKSDATVEQAIIHFLDAQLCIKEGQERVSTLTDRMCRKLDNHLNLAEKIYALNDVWVSPKDATRITGKTLRQLNIAEKNGLLKRFVAPDYNKRGYSYAELMNFNKLYNKDYNLALSYEVSGKFATEREIIEKTRKQVYEDLGIDIPDEIDENEDQ